MFVAVVFSSKILVDLSSIVYYLSLRINNFKSVKKTEKSTHSTLINNSVSFFMFDAVMTSSMIMTNELFFNLTLNNLHKIKIQSQDASNQILDFSINTNK